MAANIASHEVPPVTSSGTGEIRGQVIDAPNPFPGAAEIELPEDEAVIVIEGDSNQHLTAPFPGEYFYIKLPGFDWNTF